MTRIERLARMEAIVAKAKQENRVFSADEQKEFDGHKEAINRSDVSESAAELDARAKALKRPQGALREVGRAPSLHLGGTRAYSLAKAMRSATGDRNVDAGYELEVAQELARGREKAPQGMLVPLSIFQRAADTITSSPNTGQALTATDYRPDLIERVNAAIFRPPMASALGVTTITSKESTVLIPRQKTRLQASWIARDGSASAASDAQFDNITMTPTTLALLFQMNRSLMYGTHPAAEELLLNDARIAIETGLDDAIINGTGASNQPLGFLGTGGATASTTYGGATHITGGPSGNAYGAGFTVADELQTYLKSEIPGLRWLLHPRFVGALRQTPAFSGAQVPLVGPNETAWAGHSFVPGGYALPAPSGSPLSTKGLFGSFETMVSCVFGDALDLVVNGFADSVFASGGVLVRGLLDYQQCTRDPKRVLVVNTDTVPA